MISYKRGLTRERIHTDFTKTTKKQNMIIQELFEAKKAMKSTLRYLQDVAPILGEGVQEEIESLKRQLEKMEPLPHSDPPEGWQWVACFTFPMPLKRVTLELKETSRRYPMAKVFSQSAEEIEKEGAVLQLAAPIESSRKFFRVWEYEPTDSMEYESDGHFVEMPEAENVTPDFLEQVTAEATRQVPGFADFEKLYVWADGEKGLLGVVEQKAKLEDSGL